MGCVRAQMCPRTYHSSPLVRMSCVNHVYSSSLLPVAHIVGLHTSWATPVLRSINPTYFFYFKIMILHYESLSPLMRTIMDKILFFAGIPIVSSLLLIEFHHKNASESWHIVTTFLGFIPFQGLLDKIEHIFHVISLRVLKSD